MLQRHPHLFAIALGVLLQLVALGLLMLALQLQSPKDNWNGSGYAIYPPGTPAHIAFDHMLRAGASPSGPVLGGLAWGFFSDSPETVEQLRAGDAWLVAISNPFGNLSLACGLAPNPGTPIKFTTPDLYQDHASTAGSDRD